MTNLAAMGIYSLVLICVLITTATSFSALDAAEKYENDGLTLDAQNRNCKCENGRCVTNKQGNTKCVCKPGFALQDEFTCKSCDCGSLGKCIFVLQLTSSKSTKKPEYKKKCVCDAGSAAKDGVCVACFCGDNSACDFDYGEKRCYCLNGYSEKDGVCTRCECGANGQCEYEKGVKKCECDEGFLELNGICEECDCGDNGSCSFQSGQKTCKCQQGFSVNNGKCEPCDCGSNSESCEFINKVKRCNCKDRYADRYGTCEECYCGAYSRNCNFNDNQKTCSCLDDYVQKGETCELACSVNKPCHNGGYCKEGFCFCQKGTNGKFCDVIDGCSNLCPNNQTDITCSYDVASQGAYCKCIDNNLKYDFMTEQCRRTCVKHEECVNGMCIGDFCVCLPASRGDRCEIVDCPSGVIKCERQMYVLWWGGDTMFLFQGQNLLRFQRQEGGSEKAVQECDLNSEHNIQCEHDLTINWNGRDKLCVPWRQVLVMSFRRQESAVDQQIQGQQIGVLLPQRKM